MMGTREKITYCLANVAAVLSALYVAFWLDLDRPYWAMFSVFIVSKPLSGAVRAKGMYRLAGTLIGASMSVFLVPPLVQAPVLLSLAVSLWIGLCLFFALQDRTPSSYAFLLAGYSVAIVGLSTVNQPTTIFDVAISRFEEISIGIICASIAHSVFFPRNVGDVLRSKADAAIAHTAQVALKAIGPDPVPPSVGDVATLGSTLTDIAALYAQIGHETPDVPRVPGVVTALLDRLAMALPRASLVYRSLAALRQEGPISDRLRSALSDTSVTLWSLARGETPTLGDRPAASNPASEILPEKRSSEVVSLEVLAMRHAAMLVEALVESKRLARALNDRDAAKHISALASFRSRWPFYRDQPLAFLSAASATAATLVACALWIETSWPEGFVAAQFAAICCSLFAVYDSPSKPIFEAVIGIIVALPAAAVYEFAILPGVDGFVSLAVVMTPILLFFSYLQTFERLEGAAMVLAIAFSGALALQESFASDFASFVNANLAEIVGPLIAAAMLIVFRTVDPIWNAHRILKSGWAFVAELASSRSSDMTAWGLPMFDRVGQAAMRLAASGPDGAHVDVLAGLRIGLNLTDLRRSEEVLPQNAGLRIDSAISQLGALDPEKRERSAAARLHLSIGLTRLSTVLDRLPPSEERLDALVAVTGLRLDLDPLLHGAAP
jgi:uncharacterized membrane protein YccC